MSVPESVSGRALVKPPGGFDLDAIQAAYVAGVKDANAFFAHAHRHVSHVLVPDALIERSADAYVKSVAVPMPDYESTSVPPSDSSIQKDHNNG